MSDSTIPAGYATPEDFREAGVLSWEDSGYKPTLWVELQPGDSVIRPTNGANYTVLWVRISTHWEFVEFDAGWGVQGRFVSQEPKILAKPKN